MAWQTLRSSLVVSMAYVSHPGISSGSSQACSAPFAFKGLDERAKDDADHPASMETSPGRGAAEEDEGVSHDMATEQIALDIHFDAETALIVVDVQNDFAHPSGSLYVAGGETVVPVINELIAHAHAAGAPVVLTADWHPEHTPHFDTDGGIWPVHCVAGTWGSQFEVGLQTHADLVVRKGADGEDGYSGFSVRDPRTGASSPTTLQAFLVRKGIERLVVVGLATDYCVKATVLDGRALGYRVDVVLDAIATVDLSSGDGLRAQGEMIAAGANLI